MLWANRLQDVQGYWAQPYIEALAAKKVIAGFPGGTFKPNEPVTRAQFAAIVIEADASTQTNLAMSAAISGATKLNLLTAVVSWLGIQAVCFNHSSKSLGFRWFLSQWSELINNRVRSPFTRCCPDS